MVLSNGSQFLEWLNDNAALVSALATVAIAVLTFRLASENRRLRQAGEEPDVVAYLSPHPDGNGAVNIIFANIGAGPAKAVSFQFQCEPDDFKDHRVLVTNEEGRAAINVLPQGEKLTVLFGVGFELYGKIGDKNIDPLKKFKVEITYQSLGGKKKRSTSEIDIKQFDGLAGLTNKPAIRGIEQALQNIDKKFGVVASASKAFVDFVNVKTLKDTHIQRKVGGSGDEE